MSLTVALDPETADAVLALSVASGLSPASVVRALLSRDDTDAPQARQRRRAARPLLAVGISAAALLALAIAARRHTRA